jgi:hypothetical protein
MFAQQLETAIEGARGYATLDTLAQAIWKGVAAGAIGEDDAQKLAESIEARRIAYRVARDGPGRAFGSGKAQTLGGHELPSASRLGQKSRSGSRPRTDASMERRRRWASSGALPPQLQCRFTLAEAAVLAVVAAEVAKKGACTLCIGLIAAVAGVSETTVRNAMRQARKLGFVRVEERRVSAWRNLPNRVTILSPEWSAWLRLRRRGGGCNLAKATHTGSNSEASEQRERGLARRRRAAHPGEPITAMASRSARPQGRAGE